MSQNPIKQHTVPKVLLNRFSFDNRGNIYALNVKPLEWKHSVKQFNVSQIGYVPNMYTIETDDLLRRHGLEDEYFIEKKGFDYENNFLSEIFDKIIDPNHGLIGRPRAKRFIKMLLNIKHRNQAFQELYLDKRLIKEIGDKPIAALKRSEKRFKERLEAKGIPLVADKAAAYFREQLNDEKFVRDVYRESLINDSKGGTGYEQLLTDNIYQMRFFVYTTTPDYPFIINDNPGGMLMKDDTIRNVAFNENFFAFYFPIDPLNVFMFSQEFREKPTLFKRIEYRKVDKIFVDYTNKSALSLCNKYVFSNKRKTLERVRKELLDGLKREG